MLESGAERHTPDRKLGDEWSDWESDRSSSDKEINETLATFSTLAVIVIVIFFALVALGWYMIKPRIIQLSPQLATILEWSVIFFLTASIAMASLECIWVLKKGRSLFPYKLIQKFLLSILPKAVWLGGKLGMSKDQVGNSFIKVHNFITKSHPEKLNPERLLILLPRCLKKEARERLIEKTNGNEVKVLTVAGGEEARKAIRQYRPTLILALACERDLMSGIRDVAELIPVLAIPNKRPEGPCKNTDFSSDELEEVLKFIGERRKNNIGEVNS